MSSREPDPRTIEMLLAGTPARVVDALQATDDASRLDLDALREALGSLGLDLAPVAVTSASVDRLRDALSRAPRPARRPALVVMDMLVDHLTPGSALEVPRARDIVPAMQRRLDEARAAGSPVVYLVDHHEAGDPELDVWPAHNTGEPLDDIWPALRPVDGELVVTHRTYSGFFGTDLDARLRAMNVDALVLTGCLTEIHLFATAVDALQRGYHVEVPEALQAGSSALAEQVVLKTLSVMAPVQPLP
ncbi:MAG: isochorismatase family cysteine hydrolase [Polyangiales bacterium]